MPTKKVQPNTALTPREHEVAKLLAEGHSNKVIANRLGLSSHTVKFHIRNFIVRMGAQTRVDAAVKYTVARVVIELLAEAARLPDA